MSYPCPFGRRATSASKRAVTTVLQTSDFTGKAEATMEAAVTIGGSIALFVLGAILAFAVTFDIAGIDINIIGLVLMLGGVIGAIVGFSTRRATVVRDDRREF